MKSVSCGIKFRSANGASNYAFLQHSTLYPITHDSVELMNAMANRRRSDESSLSCVEQTLIEF